MKVSRRQFLQLSAASVGGLLYAKSGLELIAADETFYLDKEVEPEKWEKAVCRYCGTGCGTEVGIKDNKVVAIRGNKDYPVNKGLLCLKGLTLMYVVHSDERGLKPLIKSGDSFQEIELDPALDLAAQKIKETVEKYGPDSVALYVGAQIFTEEMYVGNKLFKGLIGTNNVEANARLCMASAVTGYMTTYGSDEPAGGYNDIENSDCCFIIGSNLAECHPIIFGRILEHKAKNPNFKLIVADPRYTPTAAHADLWIPFFPGKDMSLLNSMAYLLFKNNTIDPTFMKNHTNIVKGGAVWGKEEKVSLEDYKKFLEAYTPEKVAAEIGCTAENIIEAAKIFGQSKNVVSLWTMGFNQRKWGTWINNLMHNLHLITGKISRPGSCPLSMTGQPNACGGVREQGMLCHVLPGHRGVANPKHREEMEDIWKIPHGSIAPKPGSHTVKMFDELGDKIKLIWIVCTNPAQTLPDLNKYFPKLKKAYVIVQDIFPPTQVQKNKFPNVTGEFADLYIPSAFWIEKGGVFGNTERRSSLTEKCITPPKGLLSDGEIFVEVAKRMGYAEHFTQYPTPESIWNEYIGSTKGTDLDLSGATYTNLRKHDSIQWPATDPDNTGTEIRFNIKYDQHMKQLVAKGKIKNLPQDGIYFYGMKDGKAKIFVRPQMDPEESPDNEYPLYLTTGRVVHHWHTGTMTMRSPWLKKMVNDSFIEINIEDAKKLKIKQHDKVKVSTRRGSLVVTAKIVDTRDKKFKGVEERVSIPMPGVVFMPFFDANSLTNYLTGDGVDGMSKEPEYKICAVKIERV